VNYRELFAEVRQRPGVFGVKNTYWPVVSFVTGVDVGTDWALLTGFQEFLVTRLGYGHNVGWMGLVPRLAFPDDADQWTAKLDEPGGDAVAIDTLFRLLDEFLEIRSDRDGHLRIAAGYLEWERRR
jgi:hypothetical protein